MIRIKRVYEEPTPDDGARFLVDRLWPRSLSKVTLPLTAWLKDVAPSNDLRRWYNHEPEKWPEFQRRYAAELAANPAAHEALETLRAHSRKGTVTLLFSSREQHRNNAAALKSLLEKRTK
jgi:uncharacterized protein YeaO (DUF488 family)